MRQLPRLKRHSTLFPRILKHFINGRVVKAVKSRRHGSLWWRTTIASQAFYTQEEFKLLWERYIFIFWSNPLYCISSPKYFYTHMMNHIFLHEKGSCLFWPSIHASFFPFKCQSSPNRLFSLPIRQRIFFLAVAITNSARDHQKLQKCPILKSESYQKELIIAVKGKWILQLLFYKKHKWKEDISKVE